MMTLEKSVEQWSVRELVLAAQAGEREAFGQLCLRYEQAIYAVALRRLGNHAEAQELVQEVFIQALEKLDQLRVPECVGGWLRSIANRMAINRAMRRGPEYATEVESFEHNCATQETPLDEILRSETRNQVRAGLKRLGKLDRDTLKAFYVRGQTLVEMADAFDAPIGTIKRRLHVARKRLARELAELTPA
ncbi:MAG: sigma-70 family RNA polymerase sigma factor [Pirellulales bacterium]|nr:sigma-70 family RNA polymerase sigma factor [Pirellulales bacterium]